MNWKIVRVTKNGREKRIPTAVSERRKKKNGLAHFVNEFYIITLLRHNGPHIKHCTGEQHSTQARNYYRSVGFSREHFIIFIYKFIRVGGVRERERG